MKPGSPANDRRRFFRYLARETLVWCEDLCGKTNVKIGDLLDLPPEAISALVPRICPGVQIVPQKDHVAARLPGASELIRLFRMDEANLEVFNRFNGENSIGKVAGELSACLSWPRERSYEHVKRLFLRLLRFRVCLPANMLLR